MGENKHNQKISKIFVENAIGGIKRFNKRFNILAHAFRNGKSDFIDGCYCFKYLKF